MDTWVEPLYKVLCPNLQSLFYTIGQIYQFFGMGSRYKAALSQVCV